MKIYDVSRLPAQIVIGYDGENNWRPHSFDCSPLLANHPNGTISLWILPNGETQAFPVALERDGNTVVWTPLSEEMTAATGALQIVCVDGTDVGKSAVVLWRVDESIVPGAEHPADVPSWATQTVARAEAAADRAEEAAESVDIEHLEQIISATVEAYLIEHPVQAPVKSVNGKTGAVRLNASDVGALPSDTPIPSAVTEQTVAGWGFTKNTGTYSKPSTGIPESDLSQSVQTSLGKADTALQTAPVTSVNNKTGEVTLGAADVHALPDSTVIPVVPQMATQVDMSDWTSGKTVDAAVLKADFQSAIQRLGGLKTTVDDLQTAVGQKADSADIPTNTSDLTNDSGFQTAAQVQSAVDAVTAMMPYVVEEIAPTEEINIDDGADNVPVRDMLLNIGVQQTGEGTPSSSNVRPITGFTNASAFRSGKNLLHISGREVAPTGNILNTTPRDFSKPFLYVGITVNNYYNKNNAVYSVNGETLTVMSKSGGYGVGLNVDVEPNTDYVLSMSGGLTTSYAGFGFFDASGSFISFQYESSLSFRTPANCKYLMLVLRPKDANVEVQYTNVQLERGTTATAYEAPETVFSYDFSEPIYGGTIDPVTGVLTVTHANIDSYNGEAINEPWFSSKNAYASGSTPSAGAQVVYPLSNPVTYQLEKTAVKTKYGANTIWGNTGMISMRYCADMKIYIDQAVKDAIESASQGS